MSSFETNTNMNTNMNTQIPIYDVSLATVIFVTSKEITYTGPQMRRTGFPYFEKRALPVGKATVKPVSKAALANRVLASLLNDI